MKNYNKYLLLASAVIIGLTILGLVTLPILFISLPLIALIVLGFIFTADVKITTDDNKD